MGGAAAVGRVGALAVALGVGIGAGMSLATGVAYADPNDDSPSSSASSDGTGSDGTGSPKRPASSKPTSSATGITGRERAANARSAPKPVGRLKTHTADPSDADPSDTDPSDTEPSDTEPTTPAANDSAAPQTSPSRSKTTAETRAQSTAWPATPPTARPTIPPTARPAIPPTTPRATDPEPTNPDTASSTAAVTPPEPAPAATGPAAIPSIRTAAVGERAPRTSTLAAAAVTSPPPTPKTLVGLVTDFVAAVLHPILHPAPGSPLQFPILTAVLSAVRTEFERILFPRTTVAAARPVAALVPPPQDVDPTTQRVLVIGIDGTNLGRILADDYNQNFFTLLNTSTTAAASIVGHTTISNPSWSTILTGVWGERTGVINNVFTPWTYDRWPTVFNQLETMNPDIETMTVANWDVINAIAAAGSKPVDRNVFVPQVAGDTNWLATDDAVAQSTVAAIGSGAQTPNFLFSYFVGVDENGHMYGGSSQQYRDAIRNMDDNLGDIMAAVRTREEQFDEDWTILVVTDHGHQPQQGFGHGFQSPDETATFVIADGPGFKDGYVNQRYQIVDTTPTVMQLFGGTPRAGSDGVSLTTLGAGDVLPDDLVQALRTAIAQNGYPDIGTQVALGARTIFASIPYYVFTFGNDLMAGLPTLLALPAQIVFGGLYAATNVPAQLVALLTGVSGARLVPLLPPDAPRFRPGEQPSNSDASQPSCVAVTEFSASSCKVASVA